MLMERILCCIFEQNGLRFGNVKFENCVFICHSAHLAVSLNKMGCGSGMSNLKTAFSFAIPLTLQYLCKKLAGM